MNLGADKNNRTNTQPKTDSVLGLSVEENTYAELESLRPREWAVVAAPIRKECPASD